MAKNVWRIEDAAPATRIDVKDRKILALISENGRMPASEIAKKVLISQDAVSYRLRRLQKDQVILSVFPVIDFRLFGYQVFHVFLLLDEKERAHHESLLSHLRDHSHTHSLMLYTDTWDVEWVFVARSLEEFDDILANVRLQFPTVILDKETLAEVKEYFSAYVPLSYLQEGGISKGVSPVRSAELPKLDALDVRLIELLSRNSRQSTYEMGQQLSVSPDTVSYRLKGLISKGIITKFTALLNLSRTGHNWYTYVMAFKKFDTKDDAKMKAFVHRHSSIIFGAKMFGRWDVMLYITTKSAKDYHATVKEIKNNFSDIIKGYQTWLGHHELFFNPLPRIVLEKHSRSEQ